MKNKIFLGILFVVSLLAPFLSAAADAPTVELTSPLNNSIDADGNVTFAFSAADYDGTVEECSLYTDHTGSFVAVQTETYGQSSVQDTFIIEDLDEGDTVKWNVLCTDNESLSGFAPDHFYVNINTAPVFTLTTLPVIDEDSGTHTANLSDYVTDADDDDDDDDDDEVNFARSMDCNNTIVTWSVSNNILTYTTVENMFGTTYCNVTYDDGWGVWEARIDLTVDSVNDAPVLSIPALTAVESTTIEVNLTPYTSDVEDDSITYIIIDDDPTEVDCSISGEFLVMDAVSGFSGQTTCTILASDTMDATNQTVTINTEAMVESIAVSATAGDLRTDGSTIWRNDPINVHITNTGNVPLTVSFDTTTLTSSTNSSSTISSLTETPGSPISIAVGDTETVEISANVLATQPLGSYLGTFLTQFGSSENQNTTISYVVAEAVTSMAISPSSNIVTGDGSFSETFTVTNNGDVTLTNFNVSSDDFSAYSLQITPGTFISLASGESQVVTYSGVVPSGEGSETGTIDVASDQGTGAFTLTIRPESKLKITEIDAEVANENDDNLNDGDTINEKAKPGDKVELKVKIDNQFTDSDDKIEDIEMTVTVIDMDEIGEDDIEIDVDVGDLRGDRDTTKTVDFDVPYKVLEGNYAIDIHVEGEDQDGNLHEDDWTITLEVDKDRHEVIISDFGIDDSQLTCSRNTNVRVTVMNIGEEDEDRVRISVVSNALDLNEVRNLELVEDPEDDENEMTYTFPLDLEDSLPPGNYQIIVSLYVDNDKEDDENILLRLNRCTTDSDDDDDDGSDTGSGDNDGMVINPGPGGSIPGGGATVTPGDDTGSGVPPTTITDIADKDSTPVYLILLIIINVLFIAVFIFLLIKLLA